MCPDSRQFRARCRARARGFAIMAAMFILVVLALLGAYVLSISSAHHVGSALDIEGSRALQAARSGIDWGISRAVNDPTAFGSGNCRTGTPSINLTTGGSGDLPALSGFTVTVSCTGTAFTDGTASLYNYALVATACNQPGACPNTAAVGANYVERRLTVQISCNATLPC
jgi:MSHA biogenesis protein MshP